MMVWKLRWNRWLSIDGAVEQEKGSVENMILYEVNCSNSIA
jgi:hypothetical protein